LALLWPLLTPFSLRCGGSVLGLGLGMLLFRLFACPVATGKRDSRQCECDYQDNDQHISEVPVHWTLPPFHGGCTYHRLQSPGTVWGDVRSL
jgi:hypothetical protein